MSTSQIEAFSPDRFRTVAIRNSLKSVTARGTSSKSAGNPRTSTHTPGWLAPSLAEFDYDFRMPGFGRKYQQTINGGDCPSLPAGLRPLAGWFTPLARNVTGEKIPIALATQVGSVIMT